MTVHAGGMTCPACVSPLRGNAAQDSQVKKILGYFVNELVDIFCIFARSFCDEL